MKAKPLPRYRVTIVSGPDTGRVFFVCAKDEDEAKEVVYALPDSVYRSNEDGTGPELKAEREKTT